MRYQTSLHNWKEGPWRKWLKSSGLLASMEREDDMRCKAENLGLAPGCIVYLHFLIVNMRVILHKAL